MRTSTLSSVTHSAINSYGATASHVLAAYDGGNHRLVKKVNSIWESVVKHGAAAFSDDMRADLVTAGHEVTGYYERGVRRIANRSGKLANTVTDIAGSAIEFLSTNSTKVEGALDTSIIPRVTPITMPLARANLELAKSVAERSEKFADRVINGDSTDSNEAEASERVRKPTVKHVRRAA